MQEGDAYSLAGTLNEPPDAPESQARGWQIKAGHAIYTRQPDRWGSYRGVPVPLIGKYTALFEPGTPPPNGLPTGAGWALLRVRSNGEVVLAGRLADGAMISAAGPLIEGALWPFEAMPYGDRGSLLGVVDFASAASGEISASSIRWSRPATTSARYPAGWPDGIAIDLHGSKYEATPGRPQVSGFPGIYAPPGMTNVRFSFSGGGLLEGDPLGIAANVARDNRIAAVAPNAGQLTAAINALDGRIAGEFLHSTSGDFMRFTGVLLQKQRRAGGWFFGPVENGAMSLIPAP